MKKGFKTKCEKWRIQPKFWTERIGDLDLDTMSLRGKQGIQVEETQIGKSSWKCKLLKTETQLLPYWLSKVQASPNISGHLLVEAIRAATSLYSAFCYQTWTQLLATGWISLPTHLLSRAPLCKAQPAQMLTDIALEGTMLQTLITSCISHPCCRWLVLFYNILEEH